jgi:hypothetical protein
MLVTRQDAGRVDRAERTLDPLAHKDRQKERAQL